MHASRRQASWTEWVPPAFLNLKHKIFLSALWLLMDLVFKVHSIFTIKALCWSLPANKVKDNCIVFFWRMLWFQHPFDTLCTLVTFSIHYILTPDSLFQSLKPCYCPVICAAGNFILWCRIICAFRYCICSFEIYIYFFFLKIARWIWSWGINLIINICNKYHYHFLVIPLPFILLWLML